MYDNADYHGIDVALFDEKTSNVAGLRAVGFSGSLLNPAPWAQRPTHGKSVGADMLMHLSQLIV